MKLSVVQKMLVLCSLAVLGLGLLAGLGLWQMERVYSAASFANEHTVPSLVALNKLDAHVAKLRQRVARHVFYGDDAATMAKIDDTIVEGNQRVAEALAEYRKTIVEQEDRRRFDHVSSLKAELDASFAPALASSRAGRKGEARELLRRGDALGKELSDALVDYIHYHTALAQTSDETAREIHAGARLAMLLIVVATMTLVGFMSFAIARSVTRPLLAMQETIVRIGGSGDLRIRAPVTADDELGTMARHLNDTLAQIGASMREVIDVASRVEGSAEHLAAAAKQLTESADTQAATAADMAATVEEVSTSIGQVAEHAADTEALAGQASSHVAHGAAVVREASAEMSRNAAQVSESVAHIAVLSEQSRQVGGIVQVIREIADQTNLLALNAAIEAARAGDTGRGFAVVADEVRKLAERTATATAEIGQLIDSIQHDTAIAVGSMEASSVQANKGAALAEEAGRVFAEVSDSTQLAAARVHDIAAAAREQNTAGQAIAGNVEKVARMSEENSAATASVADSAMHLQGLATALERAIGRFRV